MKRDPIRPVNAVAGRISEVVLRLCDLRIARLAESARRSEQDRLIADRERKLQAELIELGLGDSKSR